MATAIQFNLVDRSNERTSLRIPVAELASGTIAILDAFRVTGETALADLSLLAYAGSSLNDLDKESVTLPTDDNALREVAVRFIMEDANTNQASFSIGGPNLANFPFVVGEGGDIYEWGSGTPSAALSDFVAACEVTARHPISGLTMTMKRLELIGRNN